MRVLIVSDTHRQNKNFFKVYDRVKPVDKVIHLGDAEGAEDYLQAGIECPLEIVCGNNDFFTELAKEKILELEGKKIWITHGHNYGVSMGTEKIKEEAAARGIDIVMFGHTHRPLIEIDGQVTAVNPGSLSYPRQEGRKPSFLLMEIDQDGEAHFSLNFLN